MTCFKVADHRILLAERKNPRAWRPSPKKRWTTLSRSAGRPCWRPANCPLNTRCPSTSWSIENRGSSPAGNYISSTQTAVNWNGPALIGATWCLNLQLRSLPNRP